MSKTSTWILIAVLVVVVLMIFEVLPVRRSAEETPIPTGLPGEVATPFPTLVPTPSPTPSPEALAPGQERLTDLETAESTELALEQDLDSDLNKLDSELRGL